MLPLKNTQNMYLQHAFSLETQAAPEESLIPTPNKQTPQESQRQR